MAKYRIKDDMDFSEATVKRKRTFPVGQTIALCVLVVLQIVFALIAVFGEEPDPQDIIRSYCATVTPTADGKLLIHYEFEWTALDEDEPLTWVEIGMANPHFSVDTDTLGGAAFMAWKEETEDGHVYTKIQLDRSYKGGETLRFSFAVLQDAMLAAKGDTYFYEWVPGWFNATPVQQYTFRWKASEHITYSNANKETDGYLVWEGKMDCGTYVDLRLTYDKAAFLSPTLVHYREFDASGVNDELADERMGMVVMLIFGILAIGVVELVIIDCFVSYRRGRGFMRGYGHHVHVYGRRNPLYTAAYNRAHPGRSGGGGGGGGCACACACACAGGGRAGCSQKDTYRKPFTTKYRKLQ